MKQRLGGLLTIALGAVLITAGISNSDAGTVGSSPASCGAAVIGAAAPCPTAVITVKEVTTPTPVAGDPTPPVAGWKVTITSTCLDQATNAPVHQVLLVPNNGSKDSTPVFVYSDVTNTTLCSYGYTQQAVSRFSTTYDPSSPFTIPFAGGATNSAITLTVTNTFVHSVPSTTSAAPTPTASSSSANLANTGPHAKIGASLYIGIALVLLGAVMLFGGRRRKTGSRV